MQHPDNPQLTAEWLALISRSSAAAASEIADLARSSAADLAAHFYQHMLADPHSAGFLSHEQVKTQLSQSMQRRIRRRLDPGSSPG